ncbi:hypothetical protein ACKKBG_A11320 [Auxenochlorella protothecoides x Auxenochlorella symbiontica]
MAPTSRNGDSPDASESKTLPPTWTDRILSFMPSWTHSRRRDILYVERSAQRRFLNEYRSQLKQYEPVLRARGEIVGNALLTSIFEQSLHKDGTKAPISYTGVIESSLADTSLAMLPLKSMMAPLEPLLPPILTPFVEGLKVPIRKQIQEKERQVMLLLSVVAVGCAIGGYGLGSFVSRRGGRQEPK